MELHVLAKILAGAGLVLLVAAGAVYLVSLLGLPRLPGDILVRRGNSVIYIPIATMIVISIVATIILNLIFRK